MGCGASSEHASIKQQKQQSMSAPTSVNPSLSASSSAASFSRSVSSPSRTSINSPTSVNSGPSTSLGSPSTSLGTGSTAAERAQQRLNQNLRAVSSPMAAKSSKVEPKIEQKVELNPLLSRKRSFLTKPATAKSVLPAEPCKDEIILVHCDDLSGGVQSMPNNRVNMLLDVDGALADEMLFVLDGKLMKRIFASPLLDNPQEIRAEKVVGFLHEMKTQLPPNLNQKVKSMPGKR